MATEPVIIHYKDSASPDGRLYEVESVTAAKRAHPDATIVRFARTGEPFKDGAKPAPVEGRPAVAAAGGELTNWTDDTLERDAAEAVKDAQAAGKAVEAAAGATRKA